MGRRRRAPGAAARPRCARFADYLIPRDLLDLGRRPVPLHAGLRPRGEIMADCIVLRPFADTVWYSHSDGDISLWPYGLALARGARRGRGGRRCAAAAPGPPPRTVLEPLYAGDLRRCALRLRRRRWRRVRRLEHRLEQGGRIRDLPARLRALLELWDALVAAGEPHGLLVTGPNITRAVEQGITDTQYR